SLARLGSTWPLPFHAIQAQKITSGNIAQPNSPTKYLVRPRSTVKGSRYPWMIALCEACSCTAGHTLPDFNLIHANTKLAETVIVAKQVTAYQVGVPACFFLNTSS